jgi:hypothetical protein
MSARSHAENDGLEVKIALLAELASMLSLHPSKNKRKKSVANFLWVSKKWCSNEVVLFN